MCSTLLPLKIIIVDDGSEKTINEIVDIWKKESKFKIDLIVQSNQGKMHAYKNAMKRLNTPWSLVVDSDDTVSEEMIDILYKTILSANFYICIFRNPATDSCFVYAERRNSQCANQ